MLTQLGVQALLLQYAPALTDCRLQPRHRLDDAESGAEHGASRFA